MQAFIETISKALVSYFFNYGNVEKEFMMIC